MNKPRHFAAEITKRIPSEVNRMLDELDCPEELRDLVRTHVYQSLYLGWHKRSRKK